MSKVDLRQWWMSEFSSSEQDLIKAIYQPLGNIDKFPDVLFSLSSSSALEYLSNLATWFNKPETYTIARKFLEKADEFVSDTKSVLDQHFHWQNRLSVYYRNRETDPSAIHKAIDSCERQIQISERAVIAFSKEFGSTLPMHKGYEQLSIIREKQGQYQEVVDICQKAKDQGWSGSWDKRIEKARKKISSKNSDSKVSL
jgi:hypothetical protein